jgi:formiminotetrahydrofolate cyclodeaminase
LPPSRCDIGNAGLRASALKVFINAKAIKDRDFADKRFAEVNALLTKAAGTQNESVRPSERKLDHRRLRACAQ